MLSEGIMNDCIERLLKRSNEIDIESLCCLLVTIGKEIDNASNAKKISTYLDCLKQQVEKNDISDKGLLMIFGLIELRKNGWILRKFPSFEDVSQHSGNIVDSKIMTKKSISHCSSHDLIQLQSYQNTSRIPLLTRDLYTMKHSTQTKTYTLNDITEIICKIQKAYDSQGITNSLFVLRKFKPSDESQHIEFIKIGLKMVLINNKKYLCPPTFGKLLYHAVLKKEIFQKTALTQALKETLENFEDTIIDVPMLSIYLAQIIAEMFQNDVSVEFLKEACEPIKKKAFCAELIAEIVKAASKLILQKTVVKIFKMSNLKIEYFLGGVQNSNEFLKKNVS